MKVNQAKQRLGPRIQAEAPSVTEVTCVIFISIILVTLVMIQAYRENFTHLYNPTDIFRIRRRDQILC